LERIQVGGGWGKKTRGVGKKNLTKAQNTICFGGGGVKKKGGGSRKGERFFLIIKKTQ